VLDNDTKLLFVVYKEGVYVKPNVDELNTNYIEAIDLYLDTDWITELDYNYAKNFMLWLESSVFDGLSLYMAPIDKTKPSVRQQTKLLGRSYNSKRLAYDWLHDLVFVSVSKGVEVYSINDTNNVYSYDVIRHNEIQGDVSVDPINGLLVWSQWSYNMVTNEHSGRIVRSNIDGSDIQVLTRAAKIPNTIAIDISEQIVYWIDAAVYTLNSMNYMSATDATVIMTSRNLFDASFSMDVFGDQIFWSNYENNAIHVTHRKGLNRTDRIVLVNAYTDIEGIKVLDRTRQTNGTNRCLGAKCTHICLPTKLDYRCVCSKNTNLYADICTDETVCCVYMIFEIGFSFITTDE